MRKLAIAFLALSLAVMAACGEKAPAIAAGADEFVLAVDDRCDMILYEINNAYYIGDALIGSGGVTNANQSAPLQKNGTYWHSFSSGMFPENTDISQFEIELSVTLADKRGFPAGRLAIDAQWGKIYHLELTGNDVDGFSSILR